MEQDQLKLNKSLIKKSFELWDSQFVPSVKLKHQECQMPHKYEGEEKSSLHYFQMHRWGCLGVLRRGSEELGQCWWLEEGEWTKKRIKREKAENEWFWMELKGKQALERLRERFRAEQPTQTSSKPFCKVHDMLWMSAAILISLF